MKIFYLGNGSQSCSDFFRFRQRKIKPPAQPARSHRRKSFIDQGKKRACFGFILDCRKYLQIPAGGFVNDKIIFCRVPLNLIYMLRPDFLRLIDIAQNRTGRNHRRIMPFNAALCQYVGSKILI